MKLSDIKLAEWSNIAEIFASVVVVFSLGYVGFELNQNTQALQHTSYQNLLALLSEGDMVLAQDVDLHRIVSLSVAKPENVNPNDWSRFTHYA